MSINGFGYGHEPFYVCLETLGKLLCLINVCPPQQVNGDIFVIVPYGIGEAKHI
jgi:hypothetical protein